MVLYTLTITVSITINDVIKLFPVNVAIVVMAALFIPFNGLVGMIQTQIFDLRNSLINKLLTLGGLN